VTDYTTKAFISVKEVVYPYKRFATRRAVCATIAQRLWHKFHWSRRIEQQELKRRFSSANELRELAFVLEMIQSWNEDASSPWLRLILGKWEAAMKSTKFYLRCTIGDTILTYEKLSTLTQIEALLNSRPLCPMTDAEDYMVLTPGPSSSANHLSRWFQSDSRAKSQRSAKFSPNSMATHSAKNWAFLEATAAKMPSRYQVISKWSIKLGFLVLLVDERYPPGASSAVALW